MFETLKIFSYYIKFIDQFYYVYLTKISTILQLIDRICGALFNCYRTEETDLHLFVLLFIPHLTYSYLNSIAHVDKQVSNISSHIL